MRFAALEHMSSASKRLWLCTDYLTDGEIATALYIAKYRKLDVKVLLGRRRAALHTSRLLYLKNQNVSVFLKPDSFKAKASSIILADDKAIFIDGELDSLAKYRRFNLSRATPQETQEFVQAFAEAAKLELPAQPVPLPLVGKSTGQGKAFGGPSSPAYNDRGSSSRAGDAYRYDQRQHPRPAGVPATLPRSTIVEQRARQQQEERHEAAPILPEGATNPANAAGSEFGGVHEGNL